MNLATKRILQASESNRHDDASRLIHKYGVLIATGECGISWHALGDDVICRRSVTQVDYCGQLSYEPFFAMPKHATPTEAWRRMSAA